MPNNTISPKLDSLISLENLPENFQKIDNV